MIARMSLQEKIGSLSNTASAIPSLELPAYQWWSEATHGVASDQNGLNPMNGHGVRNTQAEPHQTNFPFPITTGMSFNRSLWYATGQQIGLEARAFMNQGNAYSTFWVMNTRPAVAAAAILEMLPLQAPVINLAREPRWGYPTPLHHCTTECITGPLSAPLHHRTTGCTTAPLHR